MGDLCRVARACRHHERSEAHASEHLVAVAPPHGLLAANADRYGRRNVYARSREQKGHRRRPEHSVHARQDAFVPSRMAVDRFHVGLLQLVPSLPHGLVPTRHHHRGAG